MRIVDQDVGSVIAFVLSACPELPYYVEEVPEDFQRPSVFFPTPDIDVLSDTLDTFNLEHTLRIHFFGRSVSQGQSNARTALFAVARNRYTIPLLNQDGTPADGALDILEGATVRQTSDVPGACILTLTWPHREQYPEPAAEMMRRFTVHTRLKDPLDLDTLLEQALGK